VKSRRILVVVAFVLLLPVVLVGGLLLVAQSEWGERWVEQRVANHLQREVDLEGISVKLGWPPRIVFAKLRIANPEWAETPNLIDAEGLYARVMVPPLFTGRVVVPYLGATVATAGLEMDGKRATWRFREPTGEEEAESRLQLGLVHLQSGQVRYIDKREATDLDIEVQGSAGEGGELRAHGKGRFRGEAVNANVRLPDLNVQHEAPVALVAEGTVGRTKASADGTLATDGRSLDLKLRLQGQTFKDLAKVTGMVLPDSPPYTLSGRLRHEGNQWIFDPFEGKVGDSDLAGSLTYAKQKPRPFLKANLKSRVLDFDDLGPLIGAPPKTGAGETAAPEQKAQGAQREAGKRMLPEQAFGTEAWGKMDADVTLVAQKIQRPKQLPLEAFSAHLVLKDSVLQANPLEFGMAGGRIVTNAVLDGREKPMKGRIAADVKSLQLGRLFPTSKAMQEALGTFYGRAEIKGQGQSIAAIAGTGDGKASFVVEGGRASAFLMELAELDIAQVVMLLGKRNQQEELRCAVSGFDIKDGVAQAESFVIDTAETTIHVEGHVNLRDETLDLAATPNAKHQSFVSLRTPLHLAGPLRKPKVRPEAAPLVRKAAIAVGLGAINPALAVFALYEPARGKDQPCGELIAEAKRKGAGRAKEGPKDPERAARVAEQRAPVAVSEGNPKGTPGEAVAEKKKGG
jgi:uncharacterized protein involved in outer membrane biogenesis